MRLRRGLVLAGLFVASGFLVVLMGTYLWMALHGWQTAEIQANAFGEGYLELVMVSFATWTLGLLTANQLRLAAFPQEALERDGDRPASASDTAREPASDAPSARPEGEVDGLETPLVEEW